MPTDGVWSTPGRRAGNAMTFRPATCAYARHYGVEADRLRIHLSPDYDARTFCGVPEARGLIVAQVVEVDIEEYLRWDTGEVCGTCRRRATS